MKQTQLTINSGSCNYSCDRNFDDMSHQFAHSIYGTTKGMLRTHLIWQDLQPILEALKNSKPLKILDAGGGQGQLAIKLASFGHQVTLCDISQNMLAIAKNKAASLNIKITCLHCAIQDLDELLPTTFDLVINHAVLEWAEHPQALLQILKRKIKPNGFLSLMFYNYDALVFKTAMLGNFGYLQTGLKKRKRKTLSPTYPRHPSDVYDWLSSLDFKILKKTGIRIFHDYLHNKQHQRERFDELLQLELKHCHKEPYISMARYIHVVAQN